MTYNLGVSLPSYLQGGPCKAIGLFQEGLILERLQLPGSGHGLSADGPCRAQMLVMWDDQDHGGWGLEKQPTSHLRMGDVGGVIQPPS
jgi:hypothetical protein